jgi:UDP-glucuronate 4-epimerase
VGAIRGEKILITGPTGQVGLPVAIALAKDNEVWGLSRFGDPVARERLESAGVRCVAADLAAADFDALPDDVDYVLNFAVSKSNDWEYDLSANAESTGMLMARCRSARAFLHCSTTAVYQPKGHDRISETDALGDNHRVWEFLSTYSITKIAAEAVARTTARQLGIPTTIARLNVPYGDNGGWPAMTLDMMLGGTPVPVHTNAPSLYNPIHEDDIIGQIPGMLAIASVPAMIVNWAGRDAVSIEEWCGYLGGLAGVEPRFVATDQTIESVAIDTTKMHDLVGEAKVGWREGMRRMAAARHPELGIAPS